MSGPYQGRDLSNCGVGRLRVAINCGVLSVKRMGSCGMVSKILPAHASEQGNVIMSSKKM